MSRARFYCVDGKRVDSRGTKRQVQDEYSGSKVVGPFRTARGCEYFGAHPDCKGVAAAEKACKTLDAPVLVPEQTAAFGDNHAPIEQSI